MKSFASVLSNQLLLMSQVENLTVNHFIIEPNQLKVPVVRTTRASGLIDLTDTDHAAVKMPGTSSVISSISSNCSNEDLSQSMSEVVQSGSYEKRFEVWDRLGNKHTLCLVAPKKTGKGKTYRPRKDCDGSCESQCIHFCLECRKNLCYPLRFIKKHSPRKKEELRQSSCFMKHVREQFRRSKRMNSAKPDGEILSSTGSMDKPINLFDIEEV
mmetsp:Transcript_22580/g.28496  ORF Transcript_22580/g.28496 Transcript_22580/m.28496 type:complete len:213 (+) Transcript_22580:194-832(+)